MIVCHFYLRSYQAMEEIRGLIAAELRNNRNQPNPENTLENAMDGLVEGLGVGVTQRGCRHFQVYTDFLGHGTGYQKPLT